MLISSLFLFNFIKKRRYPESHSGLTVGARFVYPESDSGLTVRGLMIVYDDCG